MNGISSSVLVTLGVVAVVLLVIVILRKVLQNKRQRLPSDPPMPRPPGQSLRLAADRLGESVQIHAVGLITGIILFVAGHIALSFFGKVPESWPRTMMAVTGGTLFVAAILLRWLRLSARLRRLRKALEGTLAVGNALEDLKKRGYQIYHDFAADTFNIDHIVIGPFGVMAVETQTRPGAPSRRGAGDAIVSYDGRMLHFPRNSDYQTIDKAKHQAVWLSDWLSQTLEDPISARAIVAIPGWHVKRTSAEGIPVVNPKQFPTLFDHISHRPLSDGTARFIRQRIEQQYLDAPDAAGHSVSSSL